MSAGDSDFDVEAAKAVIRAKMKEDREQRLRWGAPGPPVTSLVWDKRVVAAYNKLFKIHAQATYHDFLGQYVSHVFGDEWWSTESSKPAGERHPVVEWYQATAKFILALPEHDQPLSEFIMPAEAGHFFRLAFNLHQIEHQGLLLDRMVKRLKYSREFQGARYEVAVAAAFARANFRIELEPEGKGPAKRCEFVATHIPTGKRYAVEAKSRHLPGVLGQPKAKRSNRQEPHVETLVRKALRKEADHERVICVDVNHPQPEMGFPPAWTATVTQQIKHMEDSRLGPALVVFTNAPFHYLPEGAPAQGETALVMGLNEPRFREEVMRQAREFPGIHDLVFHFGTPIPSRWD